MQDGRHQPRRSRARFCGHCCYFSREPLSHLPPPPFRLTHYYFCRPSTKEILEREKNTTDRPRHADTFTSWARRVSKKKQKQEKTQLDKTKRRIVRIIQSTKKHPIYSLRMQRYTRKKIRQDKKTAPGAKGRPRYSFLLFGFALKTRRGSSKQRKRHEKSGRARQAVPPYSPALHYSKATQDRPFRELSCEDKNRLDKHLPYPHLGS